MIPFKTLRIDPKVKPTSIDGLKTFIIDGSNLLVLWYHRKALIFLAQSTFEELKDCCGVLKYPDEVKDIILSQRSIICLGKSGTTHVVDLNEKTIGMRERIGEPREVRLANNVTQVIGTSEGFLLITAVGELMAFGVSYMESGRSEILHTMTRNIPINILGGQGCKGCFARSYRSHDFQTEFGSALFRDIALLNCDILFLALANGDIYWLPLLINSTDFGFNLMHCTSSTVMDIACISDGKTHKYNGIMITSTNGSTALVSPVEKQLRCVVHHFPGLIKSICFDGRGKTFYSDGLNLWCSVMKTSEKDMNFETKLLALKGVVSLNTMGVSGEVIVGCRHCILYRTDYSNQTTSEDHERFLTRSSENNADANSSLISEWHKVTHELAKIKETISTENKILKEISIATRGATLKDMIELQVKINNDYPFAVRNTLALKVHNRSLQEFSNEFWSFHILASSGKWNTAVTERLGTSLKPNTALVFIVPIDAQKLEFPVIVYCSLVLRVQLDDHSHNNIINFHEMFLRKLSLDVTYFLSPITDEVNIQQSLNSEGGNWRGILERFKHLSTADENVPKRIESKLLHCYSFQLPETKSWPDLMASIVRNPDHLVHLKPNTNSIKFRVRDIIVTFTYHGETKTVDVATFSQYVLRQIKFFVMKNICNKEPGRESVCLNAVELLKYKNINLALEVEQERGVSWGNLKLLKNEVRNLVDSSFPP